MSKYYTNCDECRKCLDFCAEGNISVPCEHDDCPNTEEIKDTIKLKTNDAKKIITDIAFDESRINNQECEALRCGIQALSIIEKIKAIITEPEHYEVSNSFENPRPNKADYDAVSADKFKRIWKAISESKIESGDYYEWFKYDYRTIAPKNHDADNPYWRIPENMDKLKFCPYCGKEIRIID